MAVLLCGGLITVSALHALGDEKHGFEGRLGRLLLGDELPEPWQDLAVLLPTGIVMLFLISVVTRWSLRPLVAASKQAMTVGPQHPEARIDTTDLPGEVTPLVDAVNAALSRLSYAYEAERRFTADAAHALRTPLAVLSLRLQLARRGECADWAGIEADMGTLTRLVDRLLKLARSDYQTHQSGPVNLSRVAREAAALIQPLAESAQRTLSVDAPHAVWVAGQLDHLRDMATNLVENALVHGEGRICIAVSARHGSARLDVMDDGPGVPPDKRDLVFDRFFKAKSDTAGSGLGLAIVRAIVLSHRGQVEIADQLTSRISVSLPLDTQGRTRPSRRPEGNAEDSTPAALADHRHPGGSGGFELRK